MARGDRRERIVHDENDRYSLIQTLGEACGKTGWFMHAWVLMDNHYHAVIETPQGNLVVGMRWFQNTYTRRFNTRHNTAPVVGSFLYKRAPNQPENQSLQSMLVRGWYWGTEQFKEVLLSRANRKAAKRNRNYQTSQMGRDHAQEEAEKLVRIGLKKYTWKKEGQVR